jgi:cytochrome c oxidase assembly protein subunit 11
MAPAPKIRNMRLAVFAGAVAASMLGLAYASVPLYRMFCQVTGFGGTTQRAETAPQSATDRSISIRFDANTSGGLDWKFHAVQTSMTVKVGEQAMAHYRAANLSGKPMTGSAIFNVTPVSAGVYFNKIQCFCFTEQTLQPGETVDMPVVFFVDPDMLDDPDAADIKEITLSYTFYPLDKPRTVSEAPAVSGGIAN